MRKSSNDIMTMALGAALLIVVSDGPDRRPQPLPGTRTAIELIGKKPPRRGVIAEALGRSDVLASSIGPRSSSHKGHRYD
jgi:hypothetical protein